MSDPKKVEKQFLIRNWLQKYKGVCLIGESVLQKCLSYRGVRFTEVSVL